jgi:hypothetical protein
MTLYSVGEKHGENAARMFREGKLANMDDVTDYHNQIQERGFSNLSDSAKKELYNGFVAGFDRDQERAKRFQTIDPVRKHDNTKTLTYPSNSLTTRTWNKTKEFFGFKQEFVTLGKAISDRNEVRAYTNDSATIPRATQPGPQGPQQERVREKNTDISHLSRREQRNAYERHVEGSAHNPAGKYDSAVPNTGATREATTGRTFNRVNSEERMAKGYIQSM